MNHESYKRHGRITSPVRAPQVFFVVTFTGSEGGSDTSPFSSASGSKGIISTLQFAGSPAIGRFRLPLVPAFSVCLLFTVSNWQARAWTRDGARIKPLFFQPFFEEIA